MAHEYYDRGHPSGQYPQHEPNEPRNLIPISSGVLLVIVGIALALLETYVLQTAAWIATIGFILIGLGLVVVVLTMLLTYFGNE